MQDGASPMNFEDAIKAHTFWKVTLRWMINGQRPIDPQTIAVDQACELGRWIHGEGQKYRHLPLFATLLGEHAEFHRVAAEVVEMIQSGNILGAEAMLEPEGRFTAASQHTIDAIRALQRAVESA